jgi:hypothetical protein
MRELTPGNIHTGNIHKSEAATIGHRIRVLRHRTLRWFQPPIRAAGREGPESFARDSRFRQDN